MKMLITGGTGCLGKSLIKEFYKDYEVTFTYNSNTEKAIAIEKEYNVKAIKTSELDNLEYNFDIVINNAGININPTITENFAEEDYEETLKVNVMLPFKIVKNTLPYMKKNNFGRIVTISSIYGKKPEVEMAAYNSSKCAVEALMKTVAKEYGEYGITANNILPTAFDSPVMQEIKRSYLASGMEEKEYDDLLLKDSPIKRLVTTEEIAKLARFLISKDASFINGVSIPLDGGYSI